MKCFKMFVIAIALFVQLKPCHAVLPQLTQEQLASIIKSNENIIQKYQIKYEINQGSFTGENCVSGNFVPNSPPFIANCESAVDFVNNLEYRQEKVSDPQRTITKQYAFDGQTGMTLADAPDTNEFFGTIVHGKPARLTENDMWWFPSLALYGCIPGMSLSDAIKNARNITITSENEGDLETYKILLEIGRSTLMTGKGGEQRSAKQIEFYQLWLAPNKGMLPVRIEALATEMSKDPMHKGLTYGKPRWIRAAQDFREIAAGIWMPYQVRDCTLLSSKQPVVQQVKINSVAINENAVITTKLNFPKGTSVKDEIKGTKYRVGMKHI